MSNENPKVQQAEQEGQWKRTVFEILKPLLVATIAGIGSLTAYILTPLNEVINSFIWKEKAELLLVSQNSETSQGDLISVDLFIQPTQPLPISNGTLQISYPKNLLRPTPDTQAALVITTPKLTSSTKINQKTLEFITESQGEGVINASLKTQNGDHSATLPFKIGPPRQQLFPSKSDFTGEWNIDLRNIHGGMKLKDVGNTINGEYHLSDGSRGQIEGTKDGKTFRVTFYRGTTPSRYWIEAIFDNDPKADLEIRGKAVLLLAAPDTEAKWKSEGDFDFYAVPKTR